MSRFFSRVSNGRQFLLQHDDPQGSKTLLIVTAGSKDSNAPLSAYAERLLANVFEKSLPILGPWRRIRVVSATERVGRLVKKHEADHVMLMGRQLAGLLEKPSGLKPGTNLTGILVDYAGRRWISTPSMSAYGSGEDRSGITASMLGHLYRHLEMLKIGLIGWDNPAEPTTCRLVETRKDWLRLKNLLRTQPIVAIDTEAHSLERINNRILTLQFGFDGKCGWVLPIYHKDSRLPKDVMFDAIAWLRSYFEKARPATHVFANAVFDLHQLISLCGVRWYNHKIYDVQAGQFNLDEMYQKRNILGFGKGEMWALGRLCLEAGMPHYQFSEIGKGDRGRLAFVPLKLVAKYGAIDVALPIRLMKMQLALARWRTRHMHGNPYKHFYRVITEVEGVKLQQFAFMERNGLLVDRKYVVEMQGPDSPVLNEIRKAEKTFLAMPEVQEANKQLLGSRNVRARTLFGNKNTVSAIFNPGKPAHQQLLFFEVMKLQPVNLRKDETGSVDDDFKKKYKDNPVVKAFSDLEEAKKLNSTFLAGYYKILVNRPDNADGHLRTKFGYLNVKTGRSASTDPNLQNIPSRNKVRAKIIKRQFISKRGRLYTKDDFSAHEFRGWGLSSKDANVCTSFWNGMKIRLNYELQREIPKEKEKWWKDQLRSADFHRQNYQRLFQVQAVNVNDEQRGGVKTTVFGSLYGYSMPTLGKVLQANKTDAIKKAIKEIDKSLEEKSSRELRDKKQDLQDELRAAAKKDWTKEATQTYDLIFHKTFTMGGKWLKHVQNSAAEHLIATNFIGGVRHLWGYLHIENSVHKAMDRRGPNSIIQGPCSNLGFRAGYETRKIVWDFFTSRGVKIDYVQCNSVHDSSEAECDIVNIPLITYLRYHSCTTMLHRFMRDRFDFHQMVGFEMDADVGPSLSEMEKASRWDLTVAAIERGIKWGNENLGWKLDVEAYMKIVRHNAKIIYEIRRREIKRQLANGDRTNFHMEMTKENCMSYGLIFKPPAADVVSLEERRGPSKQLLRELAA